MRAPSRTGASLAPSPLPGFVLSGIALPGFVLSGIVLSRIVLAGIVLALSLVMPPRPARAQASADTLRIAWRDVIADPTPYYSALRATLVLAHQAWDGLLYRDPETLQIKPAMAASWKWVDDTTLDFTLRPDVHFHNGDPFTAEDVVYTVSTVLNDPKIAVPSNYLFLAGAEKLDDLHVRLKLRRIFPAALEYIAMVLPILPHAYRERVGAEGFAQAPIGAGPYRISRVDGLREIDLERFEDYYPSSPKSRPAIARLAIAQVADAASEIDQLLTGQADWIWQFNPDQIPRITANPDLLALQAESMRVIYLGLDAAGRTGADNPLTKVKVRQAIFHAIDRAAIARQLVQGGARPLDAPCFPTQFGCDAGAAIRYDYNPDEARRLLAEAGYPDGFETDLVSYILPQWTEAVSGYLQTVGITPRLNQLPTAAAIQRTADGRSPLALGTWGSYSINDVSAILPYFFTGGSNDYAGDPEVAALVVAGGSVTSADERRRNYSAAIRLITERALWMPLSTYVTTYGLRRTLNFRPFQDELPRFYLYSWK